ncbi:hypothetical protein FACS1894161_4370 [Spirochaetia bacterium]|nr:hypothetical protein FACS1894161_4370 [Spirochaetia bacterium]
MEAVEFGTFAQDGIIEIPAEYRKDYSTAIRVIIMKENFSEKASEEKADIQKRLDAAKRLAGIASKNPLTLEEIKAERLARQ